MHTRTQYMCLKAHLKHENCLKNPRGYDEINIPTSVTESKNTNLIYYTDISITWGELSAAKWARRSWMLLPLPRVLIVCPITSVNHCASRHSCISEAEKSLSQHPLGRHRTHVNYLLSVQSGTWWQGRWGGCTDRMHVKVSPKTREGKALEELPVGRIVY